MDTNTIQTYFSLALHNLAIKMPQFFCMSLCLPSLVKYNRSITILVVSKHSDSLLDFTEPLDTQLLRHRAELLIWVSLSFFKLTEDVVDDELFSVTDTFSNKLYKNWAAEIFVKLVIELLFLKNVLSMY